MQEWARDRRVLHRLDESIRKSTEAIVVVGCDSVATPDTDQLLSTEPVGVTVTV